MGVFAEGANRLERFLAMDDDLAHMVGEMQLLRSENAVLQKKVYVCEKYVLQLGVVVAEKKMLKDNMMSLENDKFALGAATGQLKQENEGLSIQLVLRGIWWKRIEWWKRSLCYYAVLIVTFSG